MAKNVPRPQTAPAKPPGTPDNQIPNHICPHIHFRTDVIDRQILSRKQHLNLLCTPKGYRWVIKKKDESESDYMNPAKHVFVCSDKRKKTGKTYVHNFLSEIWSLLTPEMVERLKEMLMNEFGMTAEESVKFICEQRMRTLEIADRNYRTSQFDEEEDEGHDDTLQDPKIPRVIFGDPKLCDKSEFAIGIEPCHIKEFSRTVSDKLAKYVVAMMCAKRNSRHRRMAEVILNGLCNITGEKCTLDKPKNRLHRILTLVSDRTALWLADNIEDEDKKRDNDRRREDAELRKRHKEKMKDRENRKKEHEKLAKQREKQEKKRAKKEEEDAKKAKEEEERKKAERKNRHDEFEKNKQKKKDDGGEKDGGDKKAPSKGDGDKKGGAGGSSKGGSKGGTSQGGAPKKDGQKGGGGKGDGSKGQDKKGPGGGQGAGGASKGGPSKGGPSKTASKGGSKTQPAGAQKPGSAGAGNQGAKTSPGTAGQRGDQGAPSTDDQDEGEVAEKPETTENASAPTDEGKPTAEATGGETDTAPAGESTEKEPSKIDQGGPNATESTEAKPDETKPTDAPSAGDETKTAEGESKPAESEAKAADSETKPAESEAKAAESEAKAAESEAKAADSETKPAEGESKTGEGEQKEVAQKEKPDKVQEASKELIQSSMSQIADTEPVSTPRQEALQNIISTELEKRVSPQDEETKDLIKEVSSKAATWIDQEVKVVEDEYGTRDKKVSAKGPFLSLRKSTDHINVRRATDVEAVRGIRETRGKGPTTEIDTSKPMTPEDAKMWAKWAENATQMAEDWGKWIDKTIQDAEEKTIKYKSKGKEKGKQIDVDKQDWETFTGKTHEEALEWRRNRKALEEMAAKWQQKSQKQ